MYTFCDIVHCPIKYSNLVFPISAVLDLLFSKLPYTCRRKVAFSFNSKIHHPDISVQIKSGMMVFFLVFLQGLPVMYISAIKYWNFALSLDSGPATNSEFSIKYVAYLHWVAYHVLVQQLFMCKSKTTNWTTKKQVNNFYCFNGIF